MARKKYQYAIVGGGMSGLILSTALSNAGYTCLLLESTENLGGAFRTKNLENHNLNGFAQLIPNTEENKATLKQLSNLLGKEINFNELILNRTTFDSGKFKEFVGFGNNPPEFIEPLNQHLENQCLELESNSNDWLNQLIEQNKADVYTRAHVTNFEIEDSNIKLIEVNDSRLFEAEKIIFTAPINSFLNLETGLLNKKQLQKIGKAKSWTSIELDLIHSKKVTDSKDLHLLKGSTDKAIPCTGRFFPTDSEDKQDSRWISFISSEFMDDMEATGLLIREMKKQIKRAYPESLEELQFEKITIYPHSHYPSELRLENHKVDKLDNFYLISASLLDSNHYLQAFSAAFDILKLENIEIPQLSSEIENSETIEITEINANSHLENQISL